ncbi:MAG TPA: hypothetical protein VFX96_11630, partial [Pyrinomonadaceae bacterium]|nr:hypothetical protein [Pyrinomonadaceae bacterium]
MIFRRTLLMLAAALFALAFAAPRAEAQPGGDVVIVLPFENTSNLKDYNWVGESFADSLSELLNVPGLVVVSGDEREMVYQRLHLPQTILPSRATAIKLGREARATLV